MKPITRTQEDEIAKMVEEKVSPLGEKLEEISAKLNEREKRPKEEKIEEIIAKIRAKKMETIQEKPKEKPKEEVKDEHVHDDIDCPTCSKGHVHKIAESGRLKCSEDKCGEEFLVIPTHADAFCIGCGLPLKRPEGDKKIESCPGCGGQKAALIGKTGIPDIKFDFSKIKK